MDPPDVQELGVKVRIKARVRISVYILSKCFCGLGP